MLKGWFAGTGILFAFCGISCADSIQLSSGKQVQGTVTTYKDNAFEVRGSDGKNTSFSANKIKRIQFEWRVEPTTIVKRTKEVQMAKIVLYEKSAFNLEGVGEPMLVNSIERIQFVPDRGQADDILTHGERVDIKQHLVPGRVTIVEFYADWCGPCKVIAPWLAQFVKSDPQVVLRKIDIVNWSSPVVQQYNVHSIPHFMVYGRNGQLVGEVRGVSTDEVQQYVAQAKNG